MPRAKKIAPPEGGSVQETGEGGVRQVVKQMSGFASEKELEDSLPENTMTDATNGEAGEVKQRKPRRSKEEMKRARGGDEPEVDPLMLDPRYKKAVEGMRSAGITKTVNSGFDGAALMTKDNAWKLDEEEYKSVDDFSYVCSKRYPLLDPTGHWITMTLYFLALIGTLIFKRAAKMNGETWMKKLTDMFGFGEDEKTAQELENEKQGSV